VQTPSAPVKTIKKKVTDTSGVAKKLFDDSDSDLDA